MAKGILNLSNYSGGLNKKTNSRDIEDNQFQELDTLSIEVPGKLKVMGAATDYAGSTTGDKNTEINIGNGLFHFNADHDIDNTDGAYVNTEMLFLNTDVTADGVEVFNINSGALSYGTKTVSYGNTFSPVVYSAVDGVVRITPTSFNDGNTPKKLEYINEVYDLGYEYSSGNSDLETAENAHRISVKKWLASDTKPADATNINVYINNRVVAYTKDTGVDIGSGSSIVGSNSASDNQINLGTGQGVNFNYGDYLLIGSEVVKVTTIAINANGPLTVDRGQLGTTRANDHGTSTNIHKRLTHNNGQQLQVGYANYEFPSGTVILPKIPEESDKRGTFNFNFSAGKVGDDGTFANDTGQFFNSDTLKVNIFHEVVYVDGQRSDLVYDGSVKNTCGSETPNNIPLNVEMWGKVPDADNIKSYKFYYNETKSVNDATRNVKYLLFELDFRKGLRLAADTEYKRLGLATNTSYLNQSVYTYPHYLDISTAPTTTAHMTAGTALNLGPELPLASLVFEDMPEATRAEAYIEQEKHVMGTAGTGYKTSTIANRRMYIGNVRYLDEVSGAKKIANDTILKSPVNNFDTFSYKDRIDVEINDGDDIIALESLGSKLLEFKRNHLYIINIARDIEYLESTLEYRGCIKDYHVVRGEGFIAWFNKYGIYMYTGKEVRNLLLDERGQERLVWSDYYHDNAIIGYEPNEKTLIIANKNQKVLSLDLKSMSFYYRSKGFEAQDTTNFVNDNDGKLLWFGKYNSTNAELSKWNVAPIKLDSANINEVALKTKEFTFGKPSVDKKIISVYLSYKNGDGVYLYGFRNDGEEELLATLDGSSETQFKTLHIKIREAKTEFSDKKAFDKIKGFGLRFSGSDVATDFEINDIQVIFREKSVK